MTSQPEDQPTGLVLGWRRPRSLADALALAEVGRCDSDSRRVALALDALEHASRDAIRAWLASGREL